MLETTRGRSNSAIALLAVAVVAAAASFPIEISQTFGLPAHPLILHAPIVLVPEAVLAVLVLAVHRGWRERFGLAAGVLAIMAMVATALSVGSGKAFAESMNGGPPGTAHHEDLGTVTLYLVIALTLVFLVLLFADQRLGWGAISTVLSVVVVVLAVLSVIWLIRTGDAGARLVWENTGG